MVPGHPNLSDAFTPGLAADARRPNKQLDTLTLAAVPTQVLFAKRHTKRKKLRLMQVVSGAHATRDVKVG